MAKQNKNDNRDENEVALLRACSLTKRDPILIKAFGTLIDAINEEENPIRVKLIEKFIENKKYTPREKAFVLFNIINSAYHSGKKDRADKKKAA